MSIRSTVRRAAASLAIGALATTGMVAVTSATAHAANESTVATLKVPKTTGAYGEYLNLTGEVLSTSGNSPYEGSVYLQRLLPGASSWSTVATDTSAGFVYFPNVSKFTGNLKYRLYYAGGSNGSTYNPITWQPSYSNVVTISTYRGLAVSSYTSGRSAGLKGKISPKKSGKITLQTKVGKKWKTVKKIKLQNGKKFKTLVKGRNGQKYRFVLAGDRNFVSTVSGTYKLRVWRY